MDPVIRHRLIWFCCVAAGCAILWQFQADFLPIDRSTGFTPIYAHSGAVLAYVKLAALLLPLIALAVIASVTGTVLSGFTMLGAALAIFAGSFGSSEGLLLRAQLPRDYATLLIETCILSLLILAAGGATTLAAAPLKAKFRSLSAADENSVFQTTLASTASSIFITTVIAAAATSVIAPVSSPKQVIGAIVLAFVLGAKATEKIVGQSGLLGTILSPFILAFIAAGYPLFANYGNLGFTRAYFTGELPGFCRILPIFFLTAGPVGAILGYSLTHPQPHDQAASEPAPNRGSSAA